MSSQRLVRLKAEMAMMAKNPAPGIHCWLKENCSDVVMVEMSGPDGSPYSAGTFQLEVCLSDRYPFTPPNVRFITPVYHPNVDPNGRICMTALKPKPTGTWAVNLNIATVLSAIRILLSEPNLDDPLMADIAKEYTQNHESYVEHAKAETKKHATKSPGGKKDEPKTAVSMSTKTGGKPPNKKENHVGDSSNSDTDEEEEGNAKKKLRLS